MKKTTFIKSIIAALLIAGSTFTAKADKGMWLIHLMAQTNYEAMKAKGVELSAEEIYSETAPSLKDAIVALDFGSCTGSMISKNGLMITNHHCAYDDIQKLSSLEHDYLKNGFWSKNQGEEIRIPGKTVMFLDRVIDVTDEYREVLKSFEKDDEAAPYTSRRANSVIEKKYAKKGYEASCAAMLRGNKYYLFYYKVYEDVRLVAAPPTCFGAFGKDTDNWSWPQHKGDFAMYRVYGDKDGNPAKYSPDNQPITPKYVLPVSVAGIKEGDYAMVLGYPGSTARYTPSFGVSEKINITNPAMIKVRDTKLAILREAMNADEKINLQYASKYFMNSNYWKYAIGECEYTKKYDVVGLKTAEEAKLTAWINADPTRKAKYGNLIEELRACYAFSAPYMATAIFHREAIINGADLTRLAMRFKGFESAMEKQGCCVLHKDCAQCKNLRHFCEQYFKDYDEQVDRKVFTAMIELYVNNIDPKFFPEEIGNLVKKFKGDYQKLTDYVSKNSVLTTKERLFAWLDKGVDQKTIDKDPAYLITKSAQTKNYELRDYLKDNNQKIGALRTLYMEALVEMNKGTVLPPDANSTMRITYGTVGGYSPKDGVTYDYRSSIDGYKEKYVENDPEFDLNPDCWAAIQKGDWGRYADKDGKLYTGFATDLDITGGNSGSPVINAKGELIGLAYDGNWESMAGDLYYNPKYNKCVCVDIRFVLWIIDKYAGASNLLNEISIVE